MKILHITSSLDPRGGGVAEAVRQLAAALVRAGHQTEVATLDSPGAPWLDGLPFPVHALGPSQTSYQYAPRLAGWLHERRGDFDCVISHGLWQYHGFAAWRTWRRRGSRGLRFIFAHGMLDPWFKRTYPRKHLKKWLYWLVAEYWSLRSARAVFFTSEEERGAARESFSLYRCHESVVSLGIQEPPPDVEAQKEAFFRQAPRLRGRRVILFLGRIHPKKGCDLLLDAFGSQDSARFVTEAPLSLVMAGPCEPGYVESLKKAFPQQADPSGGAVVNWPGMLSGEAKWGALRAAEVFVLPSHQENFGLAVVEAIACGVPVLISNKVNIWREILAGGAGFVAEDTLEGVRDLLTGWLNLSAAERMEMGKHARRCFESRFQIDRSSEALVETLREHGVKDIA